VSSQSGATADTGASASPRAGARVTRPAPPPAGRWVAGAAGQPGCDACSGIGDPRLTRARGGASIARPSPAGVPTDGFARPALSEKDGESVTREKPVADDVRRTGGPGEPNRAAWRRVCKPLDDADPADNPAGRLPTGPVAGWGWSDGGAPHEVCTPDLEAACTSTTSDRRCELRLRD